MFISQLIAFLIAAVVLGLFVVPFLRKILDKRSTEIKDTFDTFEKETAEASKGLFEFKQKLTDVAQEADLSPLARGNHWHLRQRDVLFGERRHLRQGVALAFDPYLVPEAAGDPDDHLAPDPPED